MGASAPRTTRPIAPSVRRFGPDVSVGTARDVVSSSRPRRAPLPLGDRRRNHLLFHHHVDRGPLRCDFRRGRSPEGPRRAPRAVGAHGPASSSPPPNFPPAPAATPVELGADPLTPTSSAPSANTATSSVSLAGERCVLVGDPDVIADVLVHRAHSPSRGHRVLRLEPRRRGPPRERRRRGRVNDVSPTPRFAAPPWTPTPPPWRTRACRSSRASGASVRGVYEDFNALTLGVVADALFGADVRGARAMEINAAIKEAFEFFGNRSSTGFIVPEWVPIPDNVRYNAVARLDAAVCGPHRRETRQRGESSRDTSSDDRSTRPWM